MRLTAYAGTSTVLATGVIIRALYRRTNFYSACVYLAQSNACLMILTNLAFFGLSLFMLGLQRLLYGPLRPIEIEQLYEKAWFAITETCLAMTIFRDEVGGWFLIMFVSLLIGKVWGWIGEVRVETLEQQLPINPRLFHARLSFSLFLSSLFDGLLLRYSIHTILLQARPNMMVIFAFEFAVLNVTSLSTAARYAITLYEAAVIRNQINQRRNQIRQEHEQNVDESSASTASSLPSPPIRGLSTEDRLDTVDLDVPGWEDKGRWIFYLDLVTDFLKLVLYITFFCVLCMFYGMPIHIIRDVAITIRSFYKRINDFLRYRQATRDMNARYQDATPNEISREEVCIICREDMMPWNENNLNNNRQTTNIPVDQRLRPKKLPCGHILHFACLRSWLERQQNCPTCRAPVLVSGSVVSGAGHNLPNQQVEAPNPPNQQQEQNRAVRDVQQQAVRQNVFNIGPFRVIFGAWQDLARPNHNAGAPNHPGPGLVVAEPRHQVFGPAAVNSQQTSPRSALPNIPSQLQQIEQQLSSEISNLRARANQLYLVQALQNELERLRRTRMDSEIMLDRTQSAVDYTRSLNAFVPAFQQVQFPQTVDATALGGSQALNHQILPAGMTLPEGWAVLQLQRLGGESGVTADLTHLPQMREGRILEGYRLESQSPRDQSLSQNSLVSLSSANVSENAPGRGPVDVMTTSTSLPVNNETSSGSLQFQDDTTQPAAHPPQSAGVSSPTESEAEPRTTTTSLDSKSAKKEPRLLSGPSIMEKTHITEDSATQSANSASIVDNQIDDISRMAGSTPENHVAIGKSKAATVEDYPEDADGD